jgi:uncharacterized protein
MNNPIPVIPAKAGIQFPIVEVRALDSRLRGNDERKRTGMGATILIGVARAWQIGPSRILPPTCRFAPSCSAYAIEALQRHGAARGSWLAFRRIVRCHPWGGHGYDPVP